MTSVFRCRNVRQMVPNPNLAFIRQCSERNGKLEDPKATDYPEEPTTCCMSGCPNCVWLDYAEKLSAYYKDGGEKALKEINEKVSDTNVKAFLLHELRMRQKTG